MMKNNFSFYELKQNIKEQLPLLKYNNSYSNYGNLIYNSSVNSVTSIGLESFYGNSYIDFIPSGTSKTKYSFSYIDNKVGRVITRENEVALHGFSLIPYCIKTIIDNEYKNDISYDEFIDLLIETTNCKVENNGYNYNIIFPLKNKNHEMRMVIRKTENILNRINTMYQKSGSGSWYNIFNAPLFYSTHDNFSITSGIKNIVAFDIIKEVYSKINIEGKYQ